MTMPSLAERATISAQETVEGHSFSTASLMVFTYLKFLIPKLLSDSFSDSIPFDVSNSRDASQDCNQLHYLQINYCLIIINNNKHESIDFQHMVGVV